MKREQVQVFTGHRVLAQPDTYIVQNEPLTYLIGKCNLWHNPREPPMSRTTKTLTITRDDATQIGAPSTATHAAYWLRDDGQGDIWVGFGASAEDARADGARECVEQDIKGGEILVYEIL